MTVTRLTPDACPACGRPITAATGATDRARNASPNRGDFSLCWSCGAILRYGRRLQLRLVDQAEVERELGRGRLLASDVAQMMRARAGILARGPLPGGIRS